MTIGLLLLSTFSKWLLASLHIAAEPWDNEKKLDVLTEHTWAAGEAQVSSADYEEKILPATGTRNTTIIDDEFRLGGNTYPVRGAEPRIANGSSVQPGRFHGSPLANGSLRRDPSSSRDDLRGRLDGTSSVDEGGSDGRRSRRRR